MKLTIGIDPGKSGGYAIAWGKSYSSINLHTLDEDFEFVEHMQDLKDHPDVTSMEAVVEHVPPFVGKAIPSSTSFKLGKSALDFFKAYSGHWRSRSSWCVHRSGKRD